jgi:lipoyl(octanoyl) transferase
MNLRVRWLGRVPYREALAVQEAMFRGAGQHLLLLEHPHVFTHGPRADLRTNVLVDPADVDAELVPVRRGGDVTYHGPGQIVGYPILDLRPDRCDVHRYVRDVEEVMIRTCAGYGVSSGRVAGLTGAWVGAEKIGAIGIRISRWITSHGFAFNVRTDLDHFKLIVPCGIPDRGVTSLERATGRSVPMREVEDTIVRHFAEVFERKPSRPAA